MGQERSGDHKRNTKLEGLLRELTELLSPVEADVAARYTRPRFPPVFVVGLPRCGSTLMMQCLAASGCFGYPTNLMSRFFAAPYVGARIQRLLTDPEYDFNGELGDLAAAPDFVSRLGKTRGALAPNEFWYFWRRFFPNEEPRRLDDGEIARVDAAGFLAELAAIEAALEKPVALKALLVTLNLPFLADVVSNAVFLHVKRDPIFNMQSLLLAREDYFGTRDAWYSLKPAEYDALIEEDAITQVAGQVLLGGRAIERGLATICADRVVEVGYEDFCAEPAALFERLAACVRGAGYEGPVRYEGPAEFRNTNRTRLADEDMAALRDACRRFAEPAED